PPVAGSETPPRPTSPTGEFPPAQAPAGRRSRPTLDQLTTLTPTTMARIEKDWRRKYREGVQKGDTVWLDTEQDLLISFFKRFKDGIYRVWNYPERARQLEEQGTCLLRITVSRQGTIDNVELLESSGSFYLDEEAMRAVRKGQPYGPLPAAYPNEQLHIMAHFRYSLSRGIKYPGRITGE
ncbi:MAG: energy transducer TonB, partial [Desulfuromonas sp.]|nr:energy transducer TonB [Desulfuromonas sp.]